MHAWIGLAGGAAVKENQRLPFTSFRFLPSCRPVHNSRLGTTKKGYAMSKPHPDTRAHRTHRWHVFHWLQQRFIEPIDRDYYIDFDHAGRTFHLRIRDAGLSILDSWDLRPTVRVECEPHDLPAVIDSTLAAFFQGGT
jgi:hypothetical protein